MSLARGAPPRALPPWLPLLLLAAVAGTFSSTALAASEDETALSAAPSTGGPDVYFKMDNQDDTFAPADHEAFVRSAKAARDNFMRFGRAPRDNFMRFGRAPRDNFLRFGKAGRDNFLRFGRAPKDNFLRFGKAGRDNFLRFGRAPKDNFLRFGKAGRDNFLRFGKSGRDNFLRFGKAGRDNFLRFGRGYDSDFSRDIRDRSSNNFLRFGRDSVDSDLSMEEEALATQLEKDYLGETPSEEQFMRLVRDRNFLRFGRARPDNFLRLGRGPGPDEDASMEQAEAEGAEAAQESATASSASPAQAAEDASAAAEDAAASAAAAPASSGGDADDEHVQRVGRALRPRNLFGRWKMSDLNFIRLGRSAAAAADANAAEDAEEVELMAPPVKRGGESSQQPRSGRSQVPRTRQNNYVDNFIRLGNGKRSDELLRTERAVSDAYFATTPQDNPSSTPSSNPSSSSPSPRIKRALKSSDDLSILTSFGVLCGSRRDPVSSTTLPEYLFPNQIGNYKATVLPIWTFLFGEVNYFPCDTKRGGGAGGRGGGRKYGEGDNFIRLG